MANAPRPVQKLITQVDNQVRMRLISELISGISKVLEKLLKYFNLLLLQLPLYYQQQWFFTLFLPWI